MAPAPKARLGPSEVPTTTNAEKLQGSKDEK